MTFLLDFFNYKIFSFYAFFEILVPLNLTFLDEKNFIC